MSFSCFQTLPGQGRSEACVTVFERRSHLGPPAEGRLGPSDDDDDGDDDGSDDDDGDDDSDEDEDIALPRFQGKQS